MANMGVWRSIGVSTLTDDYNVDPTTGLENFFGFLKDATAALAAGSGAVIACDINELHQVNSTYGRTMGDRCMACLAGLLNEAVAGGAGRAFRLRRDEFALLLPGVDLAAGRKAAEQVAGAYRDTTAEMGMPSTVRHVTVTYPDQVRTTAELLCMLDFSLYTRDAPGAPAMRPEELPPWVLYLIDDMTDRVLETVGLLGQARELAFTDAVSGLPNHRAAEDHLSAQLAWHARSGQPLVVLFVDGDNLKAYNEELGYEAGNEMIRQLGRVLMAGVRTGDYIARWLSGDEFLVVLPATGRERGLAVAERLRAAVAEAAGGWPLPVTVSIGVATYPADAEQAPDLLRLAAEANAAAKRRGRNRVE